MRTVFRVAVLAVLAALPSMLAVLVAPTPVLAGAWTREQGSTQIITKFGRQQRPVREARDTDDPSPATLSQLYGEYGVTDDLTVGANAWLDIAVDNPDLGSASLGVFARQRVWRRDDGRVASLQLGVSLPAERAVSREFARSKPFSATDIGLDALFGKSWWGDWGNAYLSTGLGYHHRFEDQPAELRGEVTFGVEPHRCCVAMMALHGLTPVTEGDTEGSLKLTPSVGWHVRRESASHTTLQLGASYDLLDTDDGFGVFIGVWQSF